MTELKCPFCDEKLVRYWGMEKPALYCCDNPKCSKGGIGTEQSWQALIDTKRKLDICVDTLKIMNAGLPNCNRWKWQRMKSRCYRPADPKYKNYGARGITICKEWKKDFGCFREWAIKNGYKPGLTIERIDVNGNYCPSNCKWIPMEEQAYNKTNTVYLTIDGQKLPLIKWAKKLNIDYRVLYYECIAKKRRKN